MLMLPKMSFVPRKKSATAIAAPTRQNCAGQSRVRSRWIQKSTEAEMCQWTFCDKLQFDCPCVVKINSLQLSLGGGGCTFSPLPLNDPRGCFSTYLDTCAGQASGTPIHRIVLGSTCCGPSLTAFGQIAPAAKKVYPPPPSATFR